MKFRFPRLKTKVLAALYATLIFISISFVSKRQSDRVCQKVNIEIDNEAQNYFLDDIDVVNLLTKQNKENIINNVHAFIELKSLEKRVLSHGFVEKVKVYKNIKGDLHVKVLQHEPIARLSLGNGKGKYISKKGKLLPLSDRFTARVMVLEGNFTAVLAQKDWDKDSLRIPYFEFVKKIRKDEFLNPMIASIYLNWRGEINIYPQLGNQVIEFGNPHNLDVKLAVLKAFYKDIIPAKGWNTYKKISLKFDNQLICEKY